MSRHHHRSWHVALLATLSAMPALACSDDPSGPAGPGDYPVTLTPTAQWAGNEVQLRWGYLAEETPVEFFLSPAAPPAALATEEATTFTRTSDTTGSLVLSSVGHGGFNTLSAVLASGDTVDLGTIQVGGPLGKRDFSPWGDTSGCPRYPWPRETPTGALLCIGGRVHLIRAGATEPEAVGPEGGLVAWASGFGVSYRSGVVVVPLGPDSVLAWDTATDSEMGHFEVAHGGDRAIELGPGRWALAHPVGVEVVGSSAGAIPARPTGRVLFSPDGESVVFLPDNHFYEDDLGIPVLRTSDGSLRSRLPPMSQGGGGGFASSTRFVVAGVGLASEAYRSLVRTVDVSDGSVLVETDLDFISPRDLVPEPARDRVYLFASRNDYELLLVLDQSDLSGIALMSFGHIGWGGVDYVVVLPPDDDDELSVMTVASTDRFALIP